MAQWILTVEGVTTAQAVATRNVLFYDSSTLVATFEEAIALELAFEAQVVPAWRAIINNNSSITAIKVYELFQRQQFKEQFFSPGLVGTPIGEPSAPFLTWSFRMLRQRGDMKNGYKRIGGVSEADVVAGVPTAGALTRLNAAAAALSATLTYTVLSNAESATPVIVKRVPIIVGGLTTGYRLPQNIAEYVFYSATAWQQRGATSQNTRKYGRGI